MTGAGRPPKPTNLHLLHGTHDASRHGEKGKKAKKKTASQPQAGIPKPPDWLSPLALTEWKRITKALHKLGWVATTDRTILAMYCKLYGELADDPEGFSLAHMQRLESVCAKLGLTPTMRTKMSVPEDDTEDDDDPLK